MRRIKWLLAACICQCCAMGVNAAPAQAPASKTSPNILMIMTDDHVMRFLGAYGAVGFETPNIDKLATEGVRFSQATYAVSICMPSRATIMLGQHLSRHRCGFDSPTNQNISRSEFSKSYPALLKQNGYYTGFIGKLGFPVAETKVRSRSKQSSRMEKEWFDFFHPYNRNGDDMPPGYYFIKNNAWGLPSSFEDGKPAYITDVTQGLAMNFLENAPADSPFYLSLHFWEPKGDYHPIKTKPEYLERFKDVSFPIPPDYVEGTNEALPEFLKTWRGVGLHRKKTDSPEKLQAFTRLQAAVLYGVDLCIGQIIEKLREQGRLENTVIIFTSDNGFMIGSHGITGKALLYEESMRAPLIVFDGRAEKTLCGKTSDAMVSTVDYAPTLLDMASIAPPTEMQGRSFLPIIQGRDIPWREFVYMENNFAMFRFPALEDVADKPELRKKTEKGSMRSRGLRSPKWKYISYFEQNPVYEELYNLEADPQEQKNLADSPEFAAILKRLRSQCLKEYETAKRY